MTISSQQAVAYIRFMKKKRETSAEIFDACIDMRDDRHLTQQHGTNETRNTLNTNLMKGHRDSSVSPCSLPEITDHRIFYILFYCEQINLKGIIFCT